MPLKCPKCGFKNRNKATFCSVCGTGLAQLPQAHAKRPPVATPLQAGQIQLQPTPKSPTVCRQPFWRPIGAPSTTYLSKALPLLVGQVQLARKERGNPPTDWNKVLFVFSLLFPILPLLLIGLVLLVFVPKMAVVMWMIPSLTRRRGASDVPIYELRVKDAAASRIVNIVAIEPTPGSIEVGDEVEIYGQWQNPLARNNVRAWEIHVTAAYDPQQGTMIPSTGMTISARKPLPRQVAVGALLLVGLLLSLVLLRL